MSSESEQHEDLRRWVYEEAEKLMPGFGDAALRLIERETGFIDWNEVGREADGKF